MILAEIQAAALTVKLLKILGVIALPMAVGYLLRRRAMGRDPGAETVCRAWSRRLKLTCIGVFVPPVAVTAMLKRPLAGTNVLAMAALGVTCVMAGALLGRLYVAIRKMPPKQGGALLGCAAMTNILSFGGLIVFTFWDNDGLQQVYLFKLLEHVVYYGVFYPWCSTFSPDLRAAKAGLLASFRNNPVTLVPIAAVVVGLAWNFTLYAGATPAEGPPPWTQALNRFLVPFHVAMLTFAVGLTLSPSRIGRYKSACAAVAGIKFIAMPLVTAAAAALCLQLGWIDGLAFRVAVALSAMPVAFNALIPPALYHLDEDLANSCWLVTTAMLAVVVPALYLVLH